MPIDYRDYPPNWKSEIRPRILARANNACEWCHVPNGAVGHRRGRAGEFISCDPCTSSVGCGENATKIVLTIAHLENPNPMDCRDENLAALCQRCHLRYDAAHHRSKAAATRAARMSAGTIPLAEVSDALQDSVGSTFGG